MVGTGRLRASFALIVALLASPLVLPAQEVLAPVRHQPQSLAKGADMPLSLPFFDDFSNPQHTQHQWVLGGSFVNQGYAPLPPTVGMVTLDAVDAAGQLYPSEMGQLFPADTLLSLPVRLDSAFLPYPHALSPADSVYLSFFYLPGGGYGNMWERVGDSPQPQDSLVLEFYCADEDAWLQVWSAEGCDADSLFARTGSYWQFQQVLIDDPKFMNDQFRFRFRNYCSLDINNKKGFLSNSDQWNLDYILLDAGRRAGDFAARDVAFVSPAPSLLRHFQAMPARQFTAADMKDSLSLLITNRFSEELASDYRYQILDASGQELYAYDGGHENTPVYWQGAAYQTAPAHARPVVDYVLPVTPQQPQAFTVRHHVREGVSGDVHTENDTVSFLQLFDSYYAYDDGTAENGYGITSTSSKIWLACRYPLHVEDTLTALDLYFNRTLKEQNADIRFFITVWDDNGGHPGQVLYRDEARRKPLFNGFNHFVRYYLESPLVCSGTIYVGLEQTSSDFLNLGFDRNCDASSDIFYRTGADWQTSILRGALMLRPCFGQRGLLSVADAAAPLAARVYQQASSIVVESQSDRSEPLTICNLLGQKLFEGRLAPRSQLRSATLPQGLYIVRLGAAPAVKVLIQ